MLATQAIILAVTGLLVEYVNSRSLPSKTPFKDCIVGRVHGKRGRIYAIAPRQEAFSRNSEADKIPRNFRRRRRGARL